MGLLVLPLLRPGSNVEGATLHLPNYCSTETNITYTSIIYALAYTLPSRRWWRKSSNKGSMSATSPLIRVPENLKSWVPAKSQTSPKCVTGCLERCAVVHPHARIPLHHCAPTGPSQPPPFVQTFPPLGTTKLTYGRSYSALLSPRRLCLWFFA